MKLSHLTALATVGLLALTAYFLPTFQSDSQKNTVDAAAFSAEKTEKETPKSLDPHDQWLFIRSYPDGFDDVAYLERMEEVKWHAIANADSREVDLTLDWQEEGPGNIGGRINVVTVSPSDPNIIYAGAANGGVFKTTDGGTNWTPIFDEAPFLSIGAITLDPDNENIVYVGTGDRNFSGSSFLGDGVYKSTNAGETWESIGLETTGIITEIIIDPTNTDRVFASTLGNPHNKTTERGLYRSDDAGETWTNKLFLADSAGVVDLVMHPEDPNTLYATGYNRTRNYYHSRISGPNGRILKTTDAGETWTELEGGLPTGRCGRIGLAISNEDPNTLYALYVDTLTVDVSEIYKTTDAGETWDPLDVHVGLSPLPEEVMGGFGWYFGEVYLNPYNNDHLVVPGVEMYHSLDGGTTWTRNVPEWWTYEVHADKHAIAFLDENSYIIGTDGGIYRTDDNGASWTDIENIPITQFYHITTHPHEEGLYAGGSQDNGSMSGNAETFNDWTRLYGGDGFRIFFSKESPGDVYYETQNGGLRFVSGGALSALLDPELEEGERVNWDMPYLVNEHTAELFVGTSHISMMEETPYGVYTAISEDLTRVGMGEVYGSTRFHTITEIDQPFNSSDLLYVGTSDGLMWKGERSSGSWSWTNITGDLPNRYITGVRCSPNKAGTVYVTLSGYKSDDGVTYVYKTDDFGETWTSISSDLPGITANDVLIIPGYDNDEYLFTALDGGVYFSQNNGDNWDYVGVGLPQVTVNELALDFTNKKLIAGTYSRSMWSYDVSWIEALDDEPDYTTIEENEQKRDLTIYPNPASQHIYFDAVMGDIVHIYNGNGQLVLAQPVHHLNGYSQVDITPLKSGVYHFKIDQKTGSIVKQ